MGRTDFSDQFRKIIKRHKCIGYDLNVMRQYACLVIDRITFDDNFAALSIFKHFVNRFKRAEYTLDIMWQTVCLIFNPIMVEGYAALFSCTAVVQSLRLNGGFEVKLKLVGWKLMIVFGWTIHGLTSGFLSFWLAVLVV